MAMPAQGTFLALAPVHRAWGQRRIIKVPAPAAGADWTFTAAPSMLTLVMSVIETITTSAQVATRRVGFATFDGDGNKLTRTFTGNSIPASKAVVASGAVGLSPLETEASGPQIASLAPILLLPSYKFGSDSFALQTEDAYTSIILQVEEYEQMPDHPLAALAAEVSEILRLREAAAYAAG